MIKTMKEFKGLFETKVKESSQVVITPHKRPDYDAIASSLAFSSVVQKIGKPSIILLEDRDFSLDKGVRSIVSEMNTSYNFMTMEEYNEKKTSNDLLLATDVNQTTRITYTADLSHFQTVFVVDHHRENELALPTEYKYIPEKASSASEIATQFLTSFNVKITSKLAEYLLLGIALDTNRLSPKCVTSQTMKACAKLMEKGADLATVYDYFPDDFESDRRMQRLVDTAIFMPHEVLKEDGSPYISAIATSKEGYFTTTEIAKAADYLRQFSDVSFAIGTIEQDKIAISARGKGNFDIATILEEMKGGGSLFSAATQLSLQEGETIEEVQAQLVKKIQSPVYLMPPKKTCKKS